MQQLRRFIDDVSQLGGEPDIRRNKGEPEVRYPLPADASEADDSADFIQDAPGEEVPRSAPPEPAVRDEQPAQKAPPAPETPSAQKAPPAPEEPAPPQEVPLDFAIDPDLDVDFPDLPDIPAPSGEAPPASAGGGSPKEDLPQGAADFPDLPEEGDFNNPDILKGLFPDAEGPAEEEGESEWPEEDDGSPEDDAGPEPDFAELAVEEPEPDFAEPAGTEPEEGSAEPAGPEPAESAAEPAGAEPGEGEGELELPEDFFGEVPGAPGPAPAGPAEKAPPAPEEGPGETAPEGPAGEGAESPVPVEQTDGEVSFPDFDDAAGRFGVGVPVGEGFAPGEIEIPLGPALDENAPEESAGEDDFGVPDGAGDGKGPKKQRGRGKQEEARQRNTLTDKEYELFKKNLAHYPLNLRLAIEELIVGNEFNDDVIFQVIQRIIKKAGPRQVASQLEKYTDTVIVIPRDFEKRTAAEYERYKRSLEYQLKNRILPGALVTIFATILVFFLYLFGRHVVYEPLRAEKIYKEGYTLLQSDLYELSEEKFDEALTYSQKKRWFYTYAREYRRKKQYARAALMYRQILARFNHEKQAGLEYAEMELYDRANYEGAVDIVRRQVLDYHINDSGGLLLLGDIFLEWGTDLDPAKLEDAREVYSTLIQLYGSQNEYLARMMRYFIRKDNLREVLSLKNTFYRQKKMPLGSRDLIELSGFLLDKLYGPLPPAEEYLRSQIEDLRDLLEKAIQADPSVPEGAYNFGRYFVRANMPTQAKSVLEEALKLFDAAPSQNHRRILKKINACRLLGEIYFAEKNDLRAQELFGRGLAEFEREARASALRGNADVGRLYSDMGDLEYFISGDLNGALKNYEGAVANRYDIPQVRYKVGYIQYTRGNYGAALGSFIKTFEEVPRDTHTLLALANTLSLRNDNSAAEGYYGRLLDILDAQRARFGVLLPQVRDDQYELVDLYMKAANNMGVTLHRIARQYGDSAKNAEGLVRLSESVRAYDALARNRETMIRPGGSNLAERNISYITYPLAEYEPEIYTEIPRTLMGEQIP
ncbi:MAG: hypothetical protein LBR23_03350 [Spirochaetaceae bacterium]|nr:hypothetical protein [Spirochaetaceae bacterium]